MSDSPRDLAAEAEKMLRDTQSEMHRLYSNYYDAAQGAAKWADQPPDACHVLRTDLLALLRELVERREGEAPAIQLISNERRRQIEKELWSEEHDDNEHEGGELAVAAACYAIPATRRAKNKKDSALPPPEWPWAENFWKPTPTDRVRELAKAGALIVAEIDRLQRIPLPAPTAEEKPRATRAECPECAKVWADAKAEHDAGGDPQSPPMVCRHGGKP